MKKIICLFITFSLALLLFGLNEAGAITIRIDQPKVRLKIPAGAEKSGIINIENPSEATATVKVYLEDWVYSSTADGSKNFYPPASTPLSCAEWITFGPAEFQVPPFGKQNVSYTVKCPAEAKGGHYAVLFFETSLGEAENEQGVSVAVMGRLGSLFTVEPEGTIDREIEVKNLSVTGNLYGGTDSDENLAIAIEFENTGNIDIATEDSTFYIMDKQGLIVARGEFAAGYTLPGDKATISSVVSKIDPSQIPAGRYDLVITIDLGGIPEVLEAQLDIAPSGKISYAYP